MKMYMPLCCRDDCPCVSQKGVGGKSRVRVVQKKKSLCPFTLCTQDVAVPVAVEGVLTSCSFEQLEEDSMGHGVHERRGHIGIRLV